MRKHLAFITAGLLGGALTVVYTLVLYGIDEAMIFNTLLYWGGLIFYLLPMIWAGRQQFSIETGKGFKQRLQRCFIVFIFANLIFYGFYTYLINTWDPGLQQIQFDLAIEKIENLAGENSEVIVEQWKKDLNAEDFRMTFGKTLFSFGRGLIGGFILSAIIAYLIERNT